MPRGQAAVGWRIGVWWREDRTFYVGDVTSYSAATGRSVGQVRFMYCHGMHASMDRSRRGTFAVQPQDSRASMTSSRKSFHAP